MNPINRLDLARQMPMRVKRSRLLCTVALVSYPVGAIILLNKGGLLLGYSFVLISFLCFVAMVGTGVLRVVSDDTKELDDLEVEIRRRAQATAYNILGILLLFSVTYLMMASDESSWWVPSSHDHWSGIFWGVNLLFWLLPATTLAWSLPREDVELDEQ